MSSKGKAPERKTPEDISHELARSKDPDINIKLDALLLENALTSVYPTRRLFWTKRILYRVLTEDRIFTALASAINNVDEARLKFLAHGIRQEYRWIFGILVMISSIGDIETFIKEDFSDRYIETFIKEDSSDRYNTHLLISHTWRAYVNISLRLRDSWPAAKEYQFSEVLSQFLPPFFILDGRSHYKLYEPTVLPFVEVRADVVSYPGLGSVSQVKINQGSYELPHSSKWRLSDSNFALKTVPYGQDFNREIVALRQHSCAYQSSHVLPLLCTFELGSVMCMLFPWADSNLHEYWMKYPQNPFQGDIKHQRCISSQLIGLGEALDAIHNPADESDGLFGFHGDIKPQSILWVESSESRWGHLCLSDFGLATKLRRSETTISSVTYMPPGNPVVPFGLHRPVDIWSMGCCLLEMVSWLLGGYEGVESFSHARASEAHFPLVSIDAFFSTKPSKDGKTFDFTVNPQVTEHMKLFRDHPDSTPFIHDLLDLIEYRMLLVDHMERIETSMLVDALREIDSRVTCMNEDQAYPRDMLKTIESRVLERLSPVDILDPQMYEVAVDIEWELRQCIRDELDKDPDLGPVLTVTGDWRHAWATSCHEYVQTIWPDEGRGEKFLLELEMLLGKAVSASDHKPPCRLQGVLCSAEDEASQMSRLTFNGTAAEITALCQFLAWVAASFRLPKADEVSISGVEFASKDDKGLAIFSISLRNLERLEYYGPGTCWMPLFPSTVVAWGFPVPVYSGTRGLQIPFEAMLDMAEVLYDVDLKDDEGNSSGIYFEGISHTLYPTAYIQEHHTIQWHLEKKDADQDIPIIKQDPALPPDYGGKPKWYRISDIETMRSARAVLGYCSEVQIQLGTRNRVALHQRILPSLSHIERPPPELSGGSVGVGSGFKGFITGNTTLNWKPRNGLMRSRENAKDVDYRLVLDVSEKDCVILCDSEPGNERAWMVSMLSLILELFNIWALKHEIRDIRYADPGPNGGAAAKAALADPDYTYAKRVAVERILESETSKQIGDIIKEIYGSIQQCIKENAGSDAGARGVIPLGRRGIVGWDWLDLIDLSLTTHSRREIGPGLAQRRRGRNTRESTEAKWKRLKIGQQCWSPLTEVVPVFLGQGMDDLITPLRETDICRQWHPLPGGLDTLYLAASVHCLRNLSKQYGNYYPLVFFDDLVWNYKDEAIFQPCTACRANPRVCVKQPQVITRMKRNFLWKSRPNGQRIPGVHDNGAVVFANKRKSTRSIQQPAMTEEQVEANEDQAGAHGDRAGAYEERAEAHEDQVEAYLLEALEERAEAHEEQVEANEDQAGAHEDRAEAYEEQVEANEDQAGAYGDRARAHKERAEAYGDRAGGAYEERAEAHEEQVEAYLLEVLDLVVTFGPYLGLLSGACRVFCSAIFEILCSLKDLFLLKLSG